MKTELTVNERSLTLFRYPQLSNETLQAWDAGDEYLIHHLEAQPVPDGQRILILNDNFGALSCWLSEKHQVTMMSDSFIAHQGTEKNLRLNQCSPVTMLTTMDPIPEQLDLVLMQIPKNNRHLIWQLSQLREALPQNCQVIAVNKVRDIHTSTLKLFEHYLGTTTTSLAWKKHRLVFSRSDCQTAAPADPISGWDVERENIYLQNWPNVYSGESLDLGARFMLAHIPQDPAVEHILDLGCGNGVLSVKAGQLNPQADITCVDESFMAVRSAQENLNHNLGTDRRFHCLTNNCLDNYQPETAPDLILCNPPFHQQQAITDHIAWQMFCDARQVLKNDGKLLVIGNRHLRYDVKLARLFGRHQVKTVASNHKFVILQATKS